MYIYLVYGIALKLLLINLNDNELEWNFDRVIEHQ